MSNDLYASSGDKSKVVAAILCIATGWLGVHNFYLGHTVFGLAKLCMNVVGIFLFRPLCLAVFLWLIVELVQILMGEMKDSSGSYVM